MIGIFIAYTLPIVEVFGYLLYLLLRELDIFLLEWLTPLAQVNKQHLVFAVAVFHQFAVLLYIAGTLVVIQNPERHADVCGVKHITRKNDNRLHHLI